MSKSAHSASAKPFRHGLHTAPDHEVTDEYASDTYRWWHLSQASPELLAALADGWIAAPGRVLDLGCGLGVELGHLAGLGFEAIGIDHSRVAIERAQASQPSVQFVIGEVRQLPFPAGAFDVLLDRGCLHYLSAVDRVRYEAEAWRVLRPGGRLLLRACLNSAGERNDLSPKIVQMEFGRWIAVAIERRPIVSDTRSMDAVVARLQKLL
jgi:SAM-dependent methyltransferase